MSKGFSELRTRLEEIADLRNVSALLEWDQQTYMPLKGTEARARQMALLAGLAHEKQTEERLGELLEALSADPSLAEEDKALVREARRDHLKAVKVPSELVREIVETSGRAHTIWVDARRKNDFGSFAPWLAKLVALQTRKAEALGFPEDGAAYDALLDGYEPGATVAVLDPIIQRTVEISRKAVEAVSSSGRKPSAEVLKRGFGEEEQRRFCMLLVSRLGFDLEAGRLDTSVHPFTTSFDIQDVRITTRYQKNWLSASIFGTLHECGHALYEQGLDPAHRGTPLSEAVSLGIHESQSRFWENQVGRSIAFWKHWYKDLQKLFPIISDVGLESFYAAINTVQPSMIRVEADEVTYNLHIAIRYEMERAIFDKSVAVQDLPSLWNDKCESYLGIRPEKDADGILQDIHWSFGGFGYFPTYLLGNLYAAQWMAAMRKEIVDLDELMERGELQPMLRWLREKIHKQGRRYPAHELCTRICGEPLNPDHFGAYLAAKFGSLYQVSL